MKKKKPLTIEPITGWLLVCRDEVLTDDFDLPPKYADSWHIAWLEPFGTKKSALEFAKRNNWSAPIRAVRGHVAVTA